MFNYLIYSSKQESMGLYYNKLLLILFLKRDKKVLLNMTLLIIRPKLVFYWSLRVGSQSITDVSGACSAEDTTVLFSGYGGFSPRSQCGSAPSALHHDAVCCRTGRWLQGAGCAGRCAAQEPLHSVVASTCGVFLQISCILMY